MATVHSVPPIIASSMQALQPILHQISGYHYPMSQTVILIHTLPNEPSHFDWLIDQPEINSEHRLLSFRCQYRPDTPSSSTQLVKHLPDHRSAYLNYEGPVSNNRGSVHRIAVGSIIELVKSAHSISILIQWDSNRNHYMLSKSAPNSNLWQLKQSNRNSPLDE